MTHGTNYGESRIEYLEARLANALRLRDEVLRERVDVGDLRAQLDRLRKSHDNAVRVSNEHWESFNRERTALRTQLETVTQQRDETGRKLYE